MKTGHQYGSAAGTSTSHVALTMAAMFVELVFQVSWSVFVVPVPDDALVLGNRAYFDSCQDLKFKTIRKKNGIFKLCL